MTQKEFLIQFTEVASKFKWEIKEGGQIRGKINNRGKEYCPLTAVCFINKGKTFSVGDYEEAGGLLDLNSKKANEIIRAADHRKGELRYLFPKLFFRGPKIRRVLLETVGLTD